MSNEINHYTYIHAKAKENNKHEHLKDISHRFIIIEDNKIIASQTLLKYYKTNEIFISPFNVEADHEQYTSLSQEDKDELTRRYLEKYVQKKITQPDFILAAPKSRTKRCHVCRIEFEDYLMHIETPSHKDNAGIEEANKTQEHDLMINKDNEMQRRKENGRNTQRKYRSAEYRTKDPLLFPKIKLLTASEKIATKHQDLKSCSLSPESKPIIKTTTSFKSPPSRPLPFNNQNLKNPKKIQSQDLPKRQFSNSSSTEKKPKKRILVGKPANHATTSTTRTTTTNIATNNLKKPNSMKKSSQDTRDVYVISKFSQSQDETNQGFKYTARYARIFSQETTKESSKIRPISPETIHQGILSQTSTGKKANLSSIMSIKGKEEEDYLEKQNFKKSYGKIIADFKAPKSIMSKDMKGRPLSQGNEENPQISLFSGLCEKLEKAKKTPEDHEISSKNEVKIDSKVPKPESNVQKPELKAQQLEHKVHKPKSELQQPELKLHKPEPKLQQPDLKDQKLEMPSTKTSLDDEKAPIQKFTPNISSKIAFPASDKSNDYSEIHPFSPKPTILTTRTNIQPSLKCDKTNITDQNSRKRKEIDNTTWADFSFFVPNQEEELRPQSLKKIKITADSKAHADREQSQPNNNDNDENILVHLGFEPKTPKNTPNTNVLKKFTGNVISVIKGIKHAIGGLILPKVENIGEKDDELEKMYKTFKRIQ